MNTLQETLVIEMEEFVHNHQDMHPEEIFDEFYSMKFSKEKESAIVEKILEHSEPGKMEMREVVQDLVVTTLKHWGFEHSSARDYAAAAFTKRYEDGILKGIGLTGWVSAINVLR